MTLVFEIEYLSGVAYAAMSPGSREPDWPPQPDRIFSAFVATWSAHGRREEETKALEWLERRPHPPLLVTSQAQPRQVGLSFVPPNDPTSAKKDKVSHVLPAYRSRQPRYFPATRPDDPVVRLVWPDEQVEDDILSALDSLAADTSYIGHSASLTRCRVFRSNVPAKWDNAVTPRRVIYPGRLDELVQAFEAGRRPGPGQLFTSSPSISSSARSVFSDRWLVLEYVKDDKDSIPDIRVSAIVAQEIRKCLIKGYRNIGLEGQITEVISGRNPDGKPANAPHLAIVPLAFAGFPHADGHLLGFGLVPPRENPLLQDETFLKAMRSIMTWDEGEERRELKISINMPNGESLFFSLSPTLEPGKKSLDPSLYVHVDGEVSRTFATVTPIVLNRHLKGKGSEFQNEIVSQIVAACRHVGLPEPATIATKDGTIPAIFPDKHAALEGAPSAVPSGQSPPWMRWRMPDYLAGRLLTHALIRFSEPVKGPVILGAGRFLGLGLCRPLSDGGGGHDGNVTTG